jgi:DNA-directed RNA polymerase specialized sigma24 family protein
MSNELSPLHAFRLFGPRTGNPETDRLREAAAACLLAELRKVIRRSLGNEHDREDAIGVTMFRLVRGGPRGVREGDPRTDDEVRAYLRAASWYNLIDVVGAALPLTDDPDAFEVAAPNLRPDEEAEIQRLRGELKAARTQLYEIVEVLSKKEGTPTDFSRSIEELRAIAAGKKSVNDVVRAELNAGDALAGSALWKTARNNIDQRFHRHLKKLHGAIEAMGERGIISRLRYLALKQVADELRVREKK